MLVKAKVDGFYGESIKRAGKTFKLSARDTQEVDGNGAKIVLTPESQFSPVWMEKVETSKPKSKP